MGLDRRAVENQLKRFAGGPKYLKLNRPCVPGDGIIQITGGQRKKLIEQFETQAGKHQLLKFVPASGAASRMFAGWFAAAKQGGFGSESADRAFLRQLKKMPFASLIEKNPAARGYAKKKDVSGLLNYLLQAGGLNLGSLPKALILFHKYPEGNVRAALEEHLVEAGAYLADSQGVCRLHFTLSEEHIAKVTAKIKDVQDRYEKMFQVRMEVSYSVQSSATNMIAIDEQGVPVRDDDGGLVFRPGGHGALLQNLAALDADLIFVKNIDNLVRQNYLVKIMPYKKALGGLALRVQTSIFAMLRELENSRISNAQISVFEEYCRQTLHASFPGDFDNWPFTKKKKRLFSVLNRPLRICAVVKNEGEPGGGPFWVEEKDFGQTLQIVEHAQIDPDNEEQQNIWRQASYFNPVDMVCCARNYKGEKFDLEKYVNRNAYLISAKTEKGRKLLCQEMPGLWNGAMACWNTVFVEMPLAVFNPVKTVDDLLRLRHAGRG